MGNLWQWRGRGSACTYAVPDARACPRWRLHTFNVPVWIKYLADVHKCFLISYKYQNTNYYTYGDTRTIVCMKNVYSVFKKCEYNRDVAGNDFTFITHTHYLSWKNREQGRECTYSRKKSIQTSQRLYTLGTELTSSRKLFSSYSEAAEPLLGALLTLLNNCVGIRGALPF